MPLAQSIQASVGMVVLVPPIHPSLCLTPSWTTMPPFLTLQFLTNLPASISMHPGPPSVTPYSLMCDLIYVHSPHCRIRGKLLSEFRFSRSCAGTCTSSPRSACLDPPTSKRMWSPPTRGTKLDGTPRMLNTSSIGEVAQEVKELQYRHWPPPTRIALPSLVCMLVL